MKFLGLLSLLARTLASSVEVILHRGFGERYFGIQSVGVFFLVLAFTTLWPRDAPTGLLLFLGLYFIGLAGGRLGVAKRRRSGEVEHSLYNGRPRLMSLPLIRRLKERQVKGLEVVLVFFGGVVLMAVSPPLGSYLMVAAVGVLVSMALAETYERVRTLDLQDALIEQQQLAARLRAGNRNS